MQREEEAEARRAARKAELGARPIRPEARPEIARAEPAEAAPVEGGRPRLQLAGRTGSGPSWRDRLAAKEAAGGATESAAAPAEPSAPAAPAPERKGGYVPPHLRARESSAREPSANGDRFARRESPSGVPPPSRSPAPRGTPPSGAEAPTEELKPSSGAWRPRFRQEQ